MAQVFGDNGGSVYEQVPSWTADQQRTAWFGGGAQPVPMMQVAPQVQAIQGYANAGAAAAGRTGTPAQTAVNINPVQRAAAAPQMTQPGQSNMMVNPAQAGTAGPVARLETQPSPGLQGRDGVAQQSAQVANNSPLDMRIEGMSPTGFQIVTPNGNQQMQGAANAGVLPNAAMAQNRYNVKFDKGEYDATNGTVKLDFAKYGGSTFTGTFAEMNKLGAAGLNKLFGNFHNGAGGNQNGNAAAATADQNRAGVMGAAPKPAAMNVQGKQTTGANAKQTTTPAAAVAPQPGAESMVGPGYNPSAQGGSGTTPQKLGAAGQQGSAAGQQQMAGVLNAQQYLAELQSPELATALKMLALG